MFMSWNEIHSGEQMVQAFQGVGGIVTRLKAVVFLLHCKHFVAISERFQEQSIAMMAMFHF